MGIMSIRKFTKRLLAPVIIVLVVAMTIGLFYIGLPSMGKENYNYSGPSIKINGQKISDADFNNYLMQASQQAQQYAQYGMAFSEAQIRDTAITLAIRNTAFEQEMKKAASKIKVTNADVNNLIKKYLPTEEELQSFMDRQGISSKNELKKLVAKDLERQKFIQYKARQLKIKVPKSEVLDNLEQIKVSHILIGTKDTNNKPLRSEAEALKRANEVYQKVVNGGDFAQLAKQYSDDPGSKDKGGVYDMPLNQFKTNMVKEFVDAALALNEGQISKPVKTQYGYHIIKLDSRLLPTGNAYKEKYREVEGSLLIQEAQQSKAFNDWMQSINDKAQKNLEILDPGLRAYRLKEEQKWAEAAQAYEKALKKGYYKNRVEMYIDASDVYLQLKQAKKAIEVLRKAPKISTDTIDYQVALANAYKGNNQAKKGQDLLVKFGAAHADDVAVHQKLKDVFTSWNLTDLAAKETQTVADIQKQEQEKLQKYQQSLQQKQQQPATTQPQQQQPATSQSVPAK